MKANFQKAKQIEKTISAMYPNAGIQLNHTTPFELLVATILSAQCTDKRVNEITARLFPKYNTPEKLATLGEEGLIPLIRDCGLFNNKSKNIIQTSKILVSEYNSQVPKTREELENLPGVGRKTCNVILANAFDIPAFPVDTHVFRVAHRLALSDGNTPEKVEEDLCNLFEPEKWIKLHHQMIIHGRTLCKARKPLCTNCDLRDPCKYYLEQKEKKKLTKTY
ncbi:MAG: endonuclease III [Firmicutes bacterium]|nr:endonuclease III [Bacillota bacterium]MDD4263721.1 endonuclease III [Bacillota bacterium]MDD4693945.1 endonuclease III [Bacillota bacterium]